MVFELPFRASLCVLEASDGLDLEDVGIAEGMTEVLEMVLLEQRLISCLFRKWFRGVAEGAGG